MKNFFQRRQDSQPTPSRSNTRANEAYKVWLPPPDTSRPAPPTAWIPASGQPSARGKGEKHRGSSRAPHQDASSAPTSSTYKYATVPNSAGFYYPNQPPQTVPPQPFPQYYPSSLPHPQPGSLDPHTDSRHGLVPYQYQYPQSFGAVPPSQPPTAPKRREDKTRNTGEVRGTNGVRASEPVVGQLIPQQRPPSSSNKRKEKDEESRARREPSYSSIREQRRTDDVEVRKYKHRHREPSETRKRRDSEAGEYSEKYRDTSKRKEPRRDKASADTRVEEGDSSDSSMRRPPSSANHRRRQSEEVKPSMSIFMTAKSQHEQLSSLSGVKLGVPMQPTAASSSSGKHTPQAPRMPVYLPANQVRSQRAEESQPGLSESDTDHGALNHGRNYLRSSAPADAKKQPKSTTVPRETLIPPMDKKVQESKGLWPFSRSKSSQKPPMTASNIPPSTAKTPVQKARADSTPSRLPPLSSEGVSVRPEYRRHASDAATGGQPVATSLQADRPQVSQGSRLPPSARDAQTSMSRAFFFAAQAGESSSRPVATASQQATLHALRSHSTSNEPPSAPHGQAQSTEQHPTTGILPSDRVRNPVVSTGALFGQTSGPSTGLNSMHRPETPLRRDVRDKADLPPIYAPAPVARMPDNPRAQDRSTTPKVSQLVAGFEARSSDLQAQVPPHMIVPPHMARAAPIPSSTRREVQLPQIYAPPSLAQVKGGVPSFTQHPSAAINAYAAPYPSSSGAQPNIAAAAPIRTSVGITDVAPSSSWINAVPERPSTNQPDAPSLTNQLRDLLSDKPSTSRNDEKVPVRETSVALESRSNTGPARTPFSSSTKPSEWSSSMSAFTQPPVQVYSVETSSLKPIAKKEKLVEIFSSNPSAGISKRSDTLQHDPTSRVLRTVVSRPVEDVHDVDRGQGRSSRSKKDATVITKTTSKESTPPKRQEPNLVSVPLAHSTNSQSRSNEKPTTSNPSLGSRSQPHVVHQDLRYQNQSIGRSQTDAPSAISTIPPASSLGPDDKLAQRDIRLATSTPTPTLPYHPSLPVPSNIPIRPSSRSAAPTSGSTYAVESPSTHLDHSSSRPSGNTSSSSHARIVPRQSSEESILKTPSSLAPSVLQPTLSRTSIPASVSSQADPRKKGIFGMFRSKAAQQAQTPAFDVWHPPPTKTSYRPGPQSSSESISNATPTSDRRSKHKVPPPIVVPNPALPITERKSPNSRVFTPFRYLTSKRHRTISTASMDAVDGTAANTVMGSPTASMQSSQMPTQSPPQRDPRVATQDWMLQEEYDLRASGKQRRLRPGVVFDVAEDPLEETKRSRPARIRKATVEADQNPNPNTSDVDSSDA